MSMKLDRRSFLVRVLGSSTALAISSRAAAQQSHFEPVAPPISDADTGATADPVGTGRGTTRNYQYGVARTGASRGSGVTDSDSGTTADPGGDGRGAARTYENGITDADSSANGSITDAPGFGRDNPLVRPPSGITDSDSGSTADPAGNGRDNN